MTCLIEIRDLLIWREKRVVLEIDHLDIERGETLAVAGPNGAGKSTLLLLLAHLLKPSHGSINYNGQPVYLHHDLEYRRRIGLVMQDALLLNQSVFRNAAIGLRFRGCQKEEIDRRVDVWLERLGISHLRGRPAAQLSGGEARRVALVRAFVLQPDLLLLDEPFSALDRSSRHKLQDDLKSILSGSNITTVFSTHSETDVQKLASRKIELEGGSLVSQG
jgi:tungstate transport system ATP-binding protein